MGVKKKRKKTEGERKKHNHPKTERGKWVQKQFWIPVVTFGIIFVIAAVALVILARSQPDTTENTDHARSTGELEKSEIPELRFRVSENAITPSSVTIEENTHYTLNIFKEPFAECTLLENTSLGYSISLIDDERVKYPLRIPDPGTYTLQCFENNLKINLNVS